MLMFYDLDVLMKVDDEILTQNKLDELYQPGFHEEARHRIALAVEFVGAPMQMVLPTCETSLRVYETTEFGLYMRYASPHRLKCKIGKIMYFLFADN